MVEEVDIVHRFFREIHLVASFLMLGRFNEKFADPCVNIDIKHMVAFAELGKDQVEPKIGKLNSGNVSIVMRQKGSGGSYETEGPLVCLFFCDKESINSFRSWLDEAENLLND